MKTEVLELFTGRAGLLAGGMVELRGIRRLAKQACAEGRQVGARVQTPKVPGPPFVAS